ncbi:MULTISPECIES: ChrR family anti-sigma-E factor [Vibrio]|uniref:Transcriptional regulator n=1 Tax=Vibrio casei TaxID=673372 RepID=A0A368LP65_9VIBR|nr:MULTISPECIES: ChrR family anti-sigma-E factor [Vibrio]RCS73628.1 transcriptional regulator [Vibrio casei]SJN16736.1 hypothetical protein FM109_00815 [Vibrio casei]HBV76357.1 transcriptional regulator [Vibrio sp.]
MTHHPKHELLSVYASGELPASLSLAIAAHIELCPQCRGMADDITVHAANTHLGVHKHNDSEPHEDAFADMIMKITQDASLFEWQEPISIDLEIKNRHYTLPRALRSLTLQKQQKLGKLTRTRIDLNEGNVKASLLHIEPGGSVPMHTHKGFELTLLLDGEFEDEMGKYTKGDFIWLNGEHEHTPTTQTGCLCFTVSDDALQFTQGISKLLNPIGQFIY